MLVERLRQRADTIQRLEAGAQNGGIRPQLVGSRHPEIVHRHQSERPARRQSASHRQFGEHGRLARAWGTGQRHHAGSVPRGQCVIYQDALFDLRRYRSLQST